LENASHTLLLICLTHELTEAQRVILEEHGYQVLVASDLRELDRISKNGRLDCAVLGEDLGSGMKHAIAGLLCDNLPTLAILEEYTVSPVLLDADHVLAEIPPIFWRLLTIFCSPTASGTQNISEEKHASL
jgi:hypothetical protein